MKRIIALIIFLVFCTQALAEIVTNWTEMDFNSLYLEIYKNNVLCEESKYLLSLKPIKLTYYKNNCVITLKKTATSESGFILMLPQSSYIPVTNDAYEIKKGGRWLYLFNKIVNT